MNWWQLWMSRRELASLFPERRQAGARALAHSHDPRAIPALQTALGDMDEGVRAEALHGLVRLRGKGALECILRHLDDPEETVRHAALQAISSIVEPVAAPALVDRLGDRSARVRRAAAAALRSLHRAWPEFRLGALADTQGDLDQLARTGDPRALRAFLTASRADDMPTRRAAARGLARFDSTAALSILVRLLRDRFPEVRREAGIALAARGDVRAIPPLLDALGANPDDPTAFQALVDMGESAVSPVSLQAGVLHRAPAAGARVLGHIGDPRGVDALLNLLFHPQPSVSAAAAAALGRIHERHPELDLGELAASEGDRDRVLATGDLRVFSRVQRLRASTRQAPVNAPRIRSSLQALAAKRARRSLATEPPEGASVPAVG